MKGAGLTQSSQGWCPSLTGPPSVYVLSGHQPLLTILRKSRGIGLSLLLCFLLLFSSTVKAQELQEQNLISFSTAGKVSYNIQKYTGFNFLISSFVKSAIKIFFKLKTKAKQTRVDLVIYSGLDLIGKKAKSFRLDVNDLTVTGIPVKNFKLKAEGPIYFKKRKDDGKSKNRAVLPLEIITNTTIDIDEVNKIALKNRRWKKLFKKIDLPIPPFGTTKVSLTDFRLLVHSEGRINIDCVLRSLKNPKNEALKMSFVGRLELRDKKILVSDLQSEAEDIFTRESEIAQSFSDMLEDLINPILNFHKYEKNGLTIDLAYMSFENNNLILKMNLRLLPPV